jgi:hypothetical protein
VHSFFAFLFFSIPVPGILGNYILVPAKKRNYFQCSFFPRVPFQEFLFAGIMFLKKQVPFIPLLPKCYNTPACRPKKSKRCPSQQHNPQQIFSVATLVCRSSYLLPSPPCQILQLARPPLVAPLHPYCSVGCCVIAWWRPSASQPMPPPLVVPSVCSLSRGICCDACCPVLPFPLIMPLHIFSLLHPPLVWLVVASRCPAPYLSPSLVVLPCLSWGLEDNDKVAATLAEVVAILAADFLQKPVVTAAHGVALGGIVLLWSPLW